MRGADKVLQVPEATIGDLVAANRILGHEQILDAYGHVSVRHPRDPDRFLLSRARSPENVEASDVLEHDLEGNVFGDGEVIAYIERFIHAAVYAARPDVNAVCHNHALSILPFGIARSARLHATVNASRLFDGGVPVWDIADEFGEETDMLVRTIDQGHSLARVLGSGTVALMRGHGSVVAAPSVRRVVRACLDMDRGARAQLDLLALGPTVGFTEAELAPHPGLPAGLKEDDREWEYLRARAGVDR